MFKSESISKLIHLLTRRQAHLYHSCQFQDFEAYLTLGGVPCRKRLEDNNLSMTLFETDSIDRENAVWDKVFLNLEDFGRTFAKGGAAVPNVYGPILLRFNPQAFVKAIDVAICLRSAGSKGFRRTQEALKSLEDVDKLFYYPVEQQYGTAALKFKALLQRDFYPTAQSVEISCTFPEGILSFTQLVDIVVDPYPFFGHDLAYYVSRSIEKHNFGFPVKRRSSQIGEKPYHCLLSGATSDEYPSPTTLVESSSCSQRKEWAQKIESKGGLLLKNYYRYLKYLRCGTLLPIQKQGKPEQPKRIYQIQSAESFFNEDILDIDLLSEQEIDFLDEESNLIRRELNSDMADWARSSEEGWFYSDYDSFFWE